MTSTRERNTRRTSGFLSILSILFVAAVGCGGDEAATPADGNRPESASRSAAPEGCHWTLDVTGAMTLSDDRGGLGFPGSVRLDDGGEEGDRHLFIANTTMATSVGYLLSVGITDDAPGKGATGSFPLTSAELQRWGKKDMEGKKYDASPKQGKGSGTINITENSAEWFAADIKATMPANDGSGEEIHLEASLRKPREGRCGG